MDVGHSATSSVLVSRSLGEAGERHRKRSLVEGLQVDVDMDRGESRSEMLEHRSLTANLYILRQIYLTLMMTSSFLVCLLGLLLYHLVKPRCVPPSEMVGEDDAGPSERSPRRFTGAETRTSERKSTNEEPGSPLPTIAGKSRKMSKVLEWRKTGMARVKDRTMNEATRSRISLVNKRETFQQKHGAQIVLVLNDLADIHEKLMK
jgi:hypothetical protein